MKTRIYPLHHLALVPLAALSLAAAAASTASAVTAATPASIGVNFGDSSFGTLAATDSAGAALYAQVGYQAVSTAATGLLLSDSTGTLTTAALTTTGANSFSAITTTVAGPDEILNNERANSSASSWSFTVASIPYANYSIVVYDLQFSAAAELGVTVGTTSYYTSSPLYSAAGYLDNNAATPYIYTQGTSTNSATPTALSDYVVFTGLSGGTQKVTLTGFNGGGERVGGFQIVPSAVPEPTAWALVTGGAGLLGLARCRSRRK